MTPPIGLLSAALAGVCWLLLSTSPLMAQQDYGYRLGDRVGGRLLYRTPGVSNYMEALDPSIQRWYLGSVHFSEHGRQQWAYTNWARNRQRRYVNGGLEGNNYYDFFGDLVTRGWSVYSWQQVQPVISGSSRVIAAERYHSWFNRLVIASDISRGRGFTIVVGDEINMTLTPMTFRKAGYNGVVTEYTAERFHATGLFSRVSFPVLGGGASQFQHFTNLAGGRATADVTNFLRLGLTYVNSHNGTGSADAFKGNAFTGRLNSEQLSQRLELLVLRLADDSPEDNEGGAVLFGDDIEISTTLVREALVDGEAVMVTTDTVFSANSLNFRPAVEGGKIQQGFLTADGAEDIVMKYQLAPEGEADDGSTLRAKLQQQLNLTIDEAEETIDNISNVRVRLVLANDYRVEMSSNRQTDRFGVPQFRVVARADGNIKNQLNQREVVFDYGIPTATQIVGFTTELRDFHGIDFYGEANLNTQYRKYPATKRQEHQAISGIVGDKHAIGWLANLSWRNGPASLYVEGFGMDDAYSTSVLPLRARGGTDYSPEATNELYDFVDDNDDNDRHPDQLRIGEGSLIPQQGLLTTTTEPRGRADPEVFPGYDENGDFISDFNQNNIFDRPNNFPDYDEPFLRYRSDRPEFLYGIDLNNNGWIERFENDDDPDYPYKRDHHGYNAQGGLQFGPDAKFRLGQLRQEMHKSERQNKTTYALFALDHDNARRGHFRVFDMLKLAEDDIPDHLVQWVIPRTDFGLAAETSGRLTPIRDLLAARDTWINTLYGEWGYNSPRGWATLHRFKWDRWHQRNTDVQFALDADGNSLLDAEGEPLVLFDPLGPDGRNGRENSGFFGIINKADYLFDLGGVQLDPRIKSEYLRDTPFGRDLEKRKSWDGLLLLQARIPLLRKTQIQLGYEQRLFYNLEADEADLAAGLFTGDFHGSTYALQLTNRSEYLGYSLTMQGGIRIDRRSLEIADRPRETETAGLSFVSIFAGLE